MRFRYRILTALLSLSLTIFLTAGLAASKKPTVSEVPLPTIGPSVEAIVEATPAIDVGQSKFRPPLPDGAPPLGFFFQGFNYDDNGLLGVAFGFLRIRAARPARSTS